MLLLAAAKCTWQCSAPCLRQLLLLTLCLPSFLVTSSVVFLSKQEGPTVSFNAATTLHNFCVWQQSQNVQDDSHPSHHDTALLITRCTLISPWQIPLLFFDKTHHILPLSGCLNWLDWLDLVIISEIGWVRVTYQGKTIRGLEGWIRDTKGHVWPRKAVGSTIKANPHFESKAKFLKKTAASLCVCFCFCFVFFREDICRAKDKCDTLGKLLPFSPQKYLHLKSVSINFSLR